MARKKQDTLVLFPDVFNSTKNMTDTQFGVLMRAVFDYRFSNRVYEGDDLAIDVMFCTVKNQIDRYRETCAVNSRNASSQNKTESAAELSGMQGKTAEPSEETENPPHTHTPNHNHSHNHSDSKADKLPTCHRFTPPTVDEVKAYCAEKGYAVDPSRFVDYYTSNGWKVGKNPMKDWKAAVRTWNGKEKNNGQVEHKPLWSVGTTV